MAFGALDGLTDEDRFAIDVYNDPTLTTAEKIARLQGGPGAVPANDPMAAPANENAIPPIPSLPPELSALPVDALAQEFNQGNVPDATDAQKSAAARAAANRPAAPAPVIDADAILRARAAELQGQARADFERQYGVAPVQRGEGGAGNVPAQPPTPVREGQGGAVAWVPTPGGGESAPGNAPTLSGFTYVRPPGPDTIREDGSPGQSTVDEGGGPRNVDPSQVQFAAQTAAEQAARGGGAQAVVVGTDTFQPYSRQVREGIVPIVELDRAGPEFEVDGKVSGLETETVIDPKTGKRIQKRVPSGLTLEAEATDPNIQPLEKFTEQAAEQEGEARADIIDATQYAEDATMRAARAAADRARQIEDDAVAEANRRRQRFADKERAFQAVIAEITNPKDPAGVDAYWAKRGTGDRIMAGIAVALGELGGAISGRQGNVAKDIIFKAIDEEIAEARQRRATRLEGARTAYDFARDQFESEETRDAAMREMMLRRVEGDFARFQQFAQTPARKAQLEALRAQWQQEADAASAARQRAMADEVVRQDRFDPKRVVIVGNQPLKKEDEERVVYSKGEALGFAPTGKRADEAQKQIDSLDAIEEELADLSRMTEQARGNITPVQADDLKKQIAAKVNLIGAAMSVAQAQGAMSDDERARMTKSLGSAEDWLNFDIDSTPRVKQSLGYFQRKKQTIIRNNVREAPRGIQTVQSGRMPKSFEGSK